MTVVKDSIILTEHLIKGEYCFDSTSYSYEVAEEGVDLNLYFVLK